MQIYIVLRLENIASGGKTAGRFGCAVLCFVMK